MSPSSGWWVPRTGTYRLVQNGDGWYWIYEGGVRHSRRSVQVTGPDGMKILEAVVDLLNGELKDMRLMLPAFQVYLHYLW
ncbi:hypothetical protein ACIBG4_40835 [Nonomuraea sp. NPDC050383]|uniref:hypothetical protein n=1 Tax=Nonomuraea sp. NPDC050383 TaxID=3364362 RepID=UPI00378C66A1